MKILVRTSDNVVCYAGDDIILGATGTVGNGWCDPHFTTANATLAEADLPTLWTGDVWTYIDGVWAVHDAARYALLLSDSVLQALVRIDADVDAIYGDVLGNRAQEYMGAEADAQDYKDAGYAGTVPPSVQGWATIKAWTPTQAADNVLATAAQWRGAQALIRDARLTRKEQVRAATDATAIAEALATWAGFVAVMRGQLGV